MSEMLHTIQKVIDKKINYIMFRDAINGNSTYMPQLSALLHEGAFCTGCISRFLYLGTKLNTSVPMPDALPSVRARCGAHFGCECVCSVADISGRGAGWRRPVAGFFSASVYNAKATPDRQGGVQCGGHASSVGENGDRGAAVACCGAVVIVVQYCTWMPF